MLECNCCCYFCNANDREMMGTSLLWPNNWQAPTLNCKQSVVIVSMYPPWYWTGQIHHFGWPVELQERIPPVFWYPMQSNFCWDSCKDSCACCIEEWTMHSHTTVPHRYCTVPGKTVSYIVYTQTHMSMTHTLHEYVPRKAIFAHSLLYALCSMRT
jgi:hypothetical protein